ncbi:PadR family transcriptional regulator [Singulisphaera acidiphila]|uniref:Putative transcriptional regulator n=1 Tax=Singulisphaera acidiphila (strain ATCC BAA-1392 / DSM 18658 / VKM B-2454 / MOB10) TaxID=886293 RepID=L0DQG3_SINAD|nr:PadR family transcriptional regulator [Singulisphaera acidiphila]AGA31679.1 putative transcriptional regulator [Singulisphaera acidiphila DSM 18658]
MKYEFLSATTVMWAILGFLETQEMKGHELRRKLIEHGYKKSPGSFYQQMARLVDCGLVEGHLGERSSSIPGLTEKNFKITATGLGELKRFREFSKQTNLFAFGS